MIAITGTWFLIQALLADNHISISSRDVPAVVAREDVPLLQAGEAPRLVSLEHAIETVKAQIPGFEASFVRLPAMPMTPSTSVAAAGTR